MLDRILQSMNDSNAQLVAVGIIVLSGLILHFVAKRTLRTIFTKAKLAQPVADLLLSLMGWIIAVLVLLMVLQQVGVLHNVWAAILAVLAAIAIGFVAGWSILSNMFCTLLLLIYKPFRVGDTVEVPVDNVTGEAVDINLMYTTLKTDDERFIQVPNNTFFTKPTVRTPGEDPTTLYDQLNAEEPFNN